jgi:hypothetical protein
MRMKREAMGVVAVLMLATAASAQERPQGAADLVGAWVGYADESSLDRALVGAAVKWQPSRHVAIGPELDYVIGPHGDRDLIVTGNLTVDILARRVTPFIVVGGGFSHQSIPLDHGTYTATHAAFTGGGGVRFAVTEHFYIAPEARIGWELQTRVGVAIGSRF